MKLGFYSNSPVTADIAVSSPLNKSFVILGASGQGKTVQAQKLTLGLKSEGYTLIIFDLHGTFSKIQIFSPLREEFESACTRFDAFTNPIATDIFTPLTYPDRTRESTDDLACHLAGILDRVFHFGSRQKTLCRVACAEAIRSGKFASVGFSALRDNLLNLNETPATAVAEELFPLLSHNSFVSGKSCVREKNITLFDVSKYTADAQRGIVELCLFSLWRNAVCGTLQPTYVVIDEFQDLDLGKSSILTDILVEGRKYNLNTMLISQSLDARLPKVVQKALLQNAYQLYFKPSSGDYKNFASLVDPAHISSWVLELQQLPVGEFVLCGRYIIDGVEFADPIRVHS